MDTLLPDFPVFMFDGKINFRTWYQETKNLLILLDYCFLLMKNS